MTTKIEHGVIASSRVLEQIPEGLRDSAMRVFSVMHEYDPINTQNFGDVQMYDTVPMFPQFDEDGNTYIMLYNYHYEAYDIFNDSKETAIVIKWDADLNVVWVRELYLADFNGDSTSFLPLQTIYTSGRLFLIGSGDTNFASTAANTFNPDARTTLVELDKNTGSILNAKNYMDLQIFNAGNKSARFTDSYHGFMRGIATDGSAFYFVVRSSSRVGTRTETIQKIVKVGLDLNVIWSKRYTLDGFANQLNHSGLLEYSNGFLYAVVSSFGMLLKINATTGVVVQTLRYFTNKYTNNYSIQSIEDIKIIGDFLFLTNYSGMFKINKNTLELIEFIYGQSLTFLFNNENNDLVIQMWYPKEFERCGSYVTLNKDTLEEIKTEHYIGHAWWCNSYDINPVTGRKMLCSYYVTQYNGSICDIVFIENSNITESNTNKSVIGDEYNSNLRDETYSAENYYRYFTTYDNNKTNKTDMIVSISADPMYNVLSTDRGLIVQNSNVVSRAINSDVNVNAYPNIWDDYKAPDERLDTFLNQVAVFSEI